jgi:hypothetical protein
MTPTQLPNESVRAFAAFKRYVEMGEKRSIRALCREHGKDRATCEKWSKKYRWQKRLRELELQDCERAVAADEKAFSDLAAARAHEQLAFQQRALEVSRKATERALAILRQPLEKTRPHDAARLLAVAYQIGADTLGLSGSGGQFGLNPTAAPVFRVVLRRDAQSDERRRLEDKFFAEHPEIKRPRNGFELKDGNGTGLAAD